MERPDYSLQTWGDAPKSSPQNSVFIDPNKSVPYDKQGDPAQANDADEGSRGRAPRGEPVRREPSGATGARSSSISRDRSSSLSIGVPERNGRSMDAGGSGAGSGQQETGGRNVAMSPSRAMGARSGSIERSSSQTRQYSRLNTLEGIGASVGPQVNADALDDRRGRPGYQNERNTPNHARLGSAKGARSVSRGRDAIPETTDEA